MGPLATPIRIVKGVCPVISYPKFKGGIAYFALHNLIIGKVRDIFSWLEKLDAASQHHWSNAGLFLEVPATGEWAGEDGAWGRIRTTDTRIFNPLLYQLSYPGQGPKKAPRVAGAASIKEAPRQVQRAFGPLAN